MSLRAYEMSRRKFTLSLWNTTPNSWKFTLSLTGFSDKEPLSVEAVNKRNDDKLSVYNIIRTTQLNFR